MLAKFVAGLAVLLLMVALTALRGRARSVRRPGWGPIYSGYLGLVLLASALVALGLVVSALTANQVVAAIVTIGLSFLLWMLDTLAAMLPDALERVLISLSLLARFTPFATGAMYLSDSASSSASRCSALFLAVRALARR